MSRLFIFFINSARHSIKTIYWHRQIQNKQRETQKWT